MGAISLDLLIGRYRTEDDLSELTPFEGPVRYASVVFNMLSKQI
jgi:hypothetical protein